MGDGKKKLQDALAKQAESYEDRQMREAQERDEAVAFFEQTIVPGFKAADAEINEQAAAHQSRREPPARAEVHRPNARDGMSVELGVRRGTNSEFWFLGILRTAPVEWQYRQSPRVKRDGTTTHDGTLEPRKWPVSMATWTADHARGDLLRRYSEVVKARNQQRR